MPGVRKAIIDYDAKEARVTYNSKKATIDVMAKALEKIGYKGSFKR